MDPITLSIMAGKALGTVTDIIDKERQKAFNTAILEGQVENLNDQITEQKLDAARKTSAIQGKGSVEAAVGGLQLSGSNQAVIGQDVFDTQLKALQEIRNLKFQRTMAELRTGAANSQLTGEQIGSAISGAASIAKTAGNAGSEADAAMVAGG